MPRVTTAATLRDLRAQPEALARCVAHLGGEGRGALRAAARTLAGARQVVVTGMGASFAAAVPFATALAAAGRMPLLMEAGELLNAYLPACRGALVVIVSRSGESVEALRLLQGLPALGATVIGVTNVADSTLARGADHALLLGVPDDSMVALQTYVATVAVLLALAAEAEGREGAEALGPAVPALAAAVDTALPLLGDPGWRAPAGVPYLLGRGASWGSALEGQLLFHEVAQVPAVAMTGHAFRHGPFEVIRPGFEAWVFTSADAPAGLNAALARDIEAAGGRCHRVGPDGLGACALPDLPAPLHAIPEIVPVQVAALRLAMARGIEAGEFRHTAKVQRREDGPSI